MKYLVRTYVTGALVKLHEVEASSREDAVAEANCEARCDWATGNMKGWDMTLDSEVDKDATEVVE